MVFGGKEENFTFGRMGEVLASDYVRMADPTPVRQGTSRAGVPQRRLQNFHGVPGPILACSSSAVQAAVYSRVCIPSWSQRTTTQRSLVTRRHPYSGFVRTRQKGEEPKIENHIKRRQRDSPPAHLLVMRLKGENDL